MKRTYAGGLLLLATIVLATALLATLSLRTTSNADRTDTTCQQVEDVRSVIRTILVNSKNATIASQAITTAQRVAIVKFYDQQLALLPTHTC